VNLRDKGSKIYSVGVIILGLGAIIPNVMVFFGSEGDVEKTFRLINMGQAFLGLLFALLGTQSVFAHKSKLGFLYYLVAVFTFFTLFSRLGA